MGDFGSATEAMRIIDLFALQIFAKNLDRCNFRVLQHHLPEADINGETGSAFIAIARVRSFATGLNRAVRSEIPGTL